MRRTAASVSPAPAGVGGGPPRGREPLPGHRAAQGRGPALSPADPKLTSCATNASICGDEARCVRTEKAAYCACRSGFHTVPGQPGCQGRKAGLGGGGQTPRLSITPLPRVTPRHQRVPALRHLLPALQQHQGWPSLQLRPQLHEDAQHLQGGRYRPSPLTAGVGGTTDTLIQTLPPCRRDASLPALSREPQSHRPARAQGVLVWGWLIGGSLRCGQYT